MFHTFNFCRMKGKKTGGRQKGTPNKENPFKGILRSISEEYFTPRAQIGKDGKPRKLSIYADGQEVSVMELADEKGNPLIMSDFQVDMLQLEPSDRVHAQLRIIKFHTPEMKSVDMDMNIKGGPITIEGRLRKLCGEDEEE